LMKFVAASVDSATFKSEFKILNWFLVENIALQRHV
jgi:hypothetical protein